MTKEQWNYQQVRCLSIPPKVHVGVFCVLHFMGLVSFVTEKFTTGQIFAHGVVFKANCVCFGSNIRLLMKQEPVSGKETSKQTKIRTITLLSMIIVSEIKVMFFAQPCVLTVFETGLL